MSQKTEQETIFGLKEIAQLLLAPFIAETAEDFINISELTEFSILDSEGWETKFEYLLYLHAM